MEPLLQSAVAVYPNNAVNQPNIPNTHWTVEIALPISKLMENNPLAQKPSDGIFWRVNFSRVQWGVKINANGKYEKTKCCQSCATPGAAAEDNWVWSKQGQVKMHLPERWGIVQFSSKVPLEEEELGDGVKMLYYEEWPCRCAAMALYYALKGYHEKEGKYTDNIALLKQYAVEHFPILEEVQSSVFLADDGFIATATIGSRTATVNQERYLVVSTHDVTNTQR